MKIKETCLYVRDVERSARFYRDVMGLEPIAYLKDRLVFFRQGSGVLLFFNPEHSLAHKRGGIPRHGSHGPQHVAFELPKARYASFKRRLRARKIRIMHELTWDSGRRSSYFRDPDGHLLEIIEEGHWESKKKLKLPF
jgi:catechol 2,3-dioxygenase-like lactoylglutathione lyase family enzyme